MKKKKILLFIQIVIASYVAFADYEDYSQKDVSRKDFSDKSLRYSNWFGSTISSAKYRRSNLTNAEFSCAILTNTDFTDAIIKGASFYDVVSRGFTEAQLKSTKSYKEKDLSGICLDNNDLSGWNFNGQNLTSASLLDATLTNTDFTDAIIKGASFYDVVSRGFTEAQLKSTKSYKEKDLRGVYLGFNDLSSWDFSGQNLTSAEFECTTLKNADFTDAIIKGTSFEYTVVNGFTETQLKSTKSYKDKDLSGICLYDNNLSGWDFNGQNLTSANFEHTTLNGTDFTNADLRGATLAEIDGTPIYKNTIMSDGVIEGFSMASADDSFSIGKYTPASSGGAVISAKISESDATISGGAKLTLEQGAAFEITNGKTLTVASDGSIQIDADLLGSTVFNIDGNAGLTFEDGAILTVNVVDTIVVGESYTFTVISFDADSVLAGLSELVKDKTLLLTINGESFAGAWDYVINGNSLSISISNIPEPATMAFLLGVLAILLAFVKRRR